MKSPLLELPGAVPPPEDSADAGVPRHFGDPFSEQRSAVRSAVVVDRSHREVIAVPGEERLSWLHLVLSQHMNDLEEGWGTESLVLDTQGRVDSHMLVAHHDGVVYLDTDAGAMATSALPSMGVDGRQSLMEYLEAMRFWSKVEPREATGEFAVFTVVGPDAATVLERAGVSPVPTQPYEVTGLPGGGFVRQVPFRGLFTADLLVPRASMVEWWQSLTDNGARPSGSQAFEALRVEALRPRVGFDTDERAIPHELGWIHQAAHVAKGATGARKPWPRSTTWASRRVGWCCCIWTVRSRSVPNPATPSTTVTARWDAWAAWCCITSSVRWRWRCSSAAHRSTST